MLLRCSPYVARLFMESFKSIRTDTENGNVPNYVETFREPVLEMVKTGDSGRSIRSCILSILKLVPRVNAKVRGEIYREVAQALIPLKSQNGVATSFLTDDQVEEYLTSIGA